jgi:hypothetical protein
VVGYARAGSSPAFGTMIIYIDNIREREDGVPSSFFSCRLREERLVVDSEEG